MDWSGLLPPPEAAEDRDEGTEDTCEIAVVDEESAPVRWGALQVIGGEGAADEDVPAGGALESSGVKALLHSVSLADSNPANAAGRLVNVGLHHKLQVGRLTCAFLLTVQRGRDGGVEARVFTHLGLLAAAEGEAEPTARERFEVLAGHALELAERLGGGRVRIGPRSQALADGAGGEGESVEI
ncbi:MAG: hypothetical protein HY721_07940 [Planctomycetes bacterium]|nr:hypothetical protein [Planctomycetota bacterium]